MAKDRIERDELASKLIETASSAEDPLRAMAELLTDFAMEAEVTAKAGAEPHERSAECSASTTSPSQRQLFFPISDNYSLCKPRLTSYTGADRSRG